jgi:hypothetical protein
MNGLKYAGLALAISFTLVLVAYAQEKACQYEGKSYPHGTQVWNLKNDNKCWICNEGEWEQGMNSLKEYCKNKY